MTETDPFNFQFPRRDQTMYLQTISNPNHNQLINIKLTRSTGCRIKKN